MELAATPVFDGLWRSRPHTRLAASGEAVGLPAGQMGNSEVGHLTIGSGRVLDQDLQRVNRAVASGAFFTNDALVSAFARARDRGGNVHLLGLVSYGGVHSHIDHLRALLELARRERMEERTWVHAFTDGRDVPPTAGVHDLAELPPERLATVTGRYYAMDRDERWERTERALGVMAAGEGLRTNDAVATVEASYAAGVTDEFVEPIVVGNRPAITSTDTVVFFNFRPDRARQLTIKLLGAGYDVTTMTRYRDDLDCPVAFPEIDVRMTLAETLSRHGLRQLHAAESEKYAHVTYFLNGGREDAWEGEERILVPSPRDVPSYDLKPEMSARELAEAFAGRIGEGFAFGIVNFANPDMVGHTGSTPAATLAVEAADAALGRVLEAVKEAGGVALVTADHGNAETMLQPDGVSPHTAHTTNPVPLVVTGPALSLREGQLSDLAPTVLALLGRDRPTEMTGQILTSAPEG